MSINENNEIEVFEISEVKSSSSQLPLNFITVGQIENDDIKIYIKQNVYKQVEEFASSDITRELGSILIGDFFEELSNTHVVISGSIEAKYTDASVSTLTFTHESWEYIHSEHDRLYPAKKIIGWQHTHPNYGVFLSNYDMFIQENFFNLPFQIAYVVDPIMHIRGFFQWKNGKVQKLSGYFIYDDIGKSIDIVPHKSEKNNQKPVNDKFNKPVITVFAFLFAAIIGLGVFALNMRSNLNNVLKQQEQTQNDLLSKIDKQRVKIESQESVVSELSKKLNNFENNNLKSSVNFIEYVVTKGDSLYSICKKNNLNYLDYLNIIKSINGIDNPNLIRAGEIILLPVKLDKN